MCNYSICYFFISLVDKEELCSLLKMLLYYQRSEWQQQLEIGNDHIFLLVLFLCIAVCGGSGRVGVWGVMELGNYI